VSPRFPTRPLPLPVAPVGLDLAAIKARQTIDRTRTEAAPGWVWAAIADRQALLDEIARLQQPPTIAPMKWPA